jgi:UDP-N-acetylglucosamine:LPS N-acetylglucosamine transferase
VLRELNLADRIPMVCVVTDPCYGFWQAWACPDVTLYLVASDDAARQLLDYGVHPDRIRVAGMPVHPKFQALNRADAHQARSELGLRPDLFTVLLNAGCEGGGNLLRIFREFVNARLNAQAIFLAGRNKSLRAEAQSLVQRAVLPVSVVGYCQQIERLMNAAHVMVSKPGGLTTFEALSCRLPIITDAITEPMPQEIGTARFIVTRGAGILPQRARDIVPVVRRMIDDTAHYAAMCEATGELVFPDATRRIVEQITSFLPRVSRSAARIEPVRRMPVPDQVGTLCA